MLKELIKNLKKEPNFFYSWQSNIAMAFKDAFDFSGHKHENEVVHEVANKAAAAFLDQLIGKDMGDVDGMAAIAKLHEQANPLT